MASIKSPAASEHQSKGADVKKSIKKDQLKKIQPL